MERSKVAMEWEARGEARGEAKREKERAEVLAGLREKVLRVLGSRFPGELPADVVAAVNAQANPLALGDWIDYSRTSATLDDVRAAFGVA